MKTSILKKVIFLCSISSIIAYGSVVFTDYADYQQFRDFAENRGNYRVGNSIIRVPLKNGTEAVMTTYGLPDFAATDTNAIGTVISPTYVGSVKHNGGYTTVAYGGKTGHSYGLIDRNDYSSADFHTPRLNKVVTDVAPVYIDFSTGNTYNYRNGFEIFARSGTGTQYIEEGGVRKYLSGAYNYRTGGFLFPSEYYWNNNNKFAITSENGKRNPNNYLHTFVQPGDSGSPIWGYHKKQQKWMLIGFGQSVSNVATNYEVFYKSVFQSKVNEDTLPDIVNTDKNTAFVWQGIDDDDIFGIGNANTGTGYITQGKKKWQYNGLKVDYDINQNNFNKDSQFIKDLNSTKHLAFAGEDGTIKLANSINMGAGMLTFKSNYLVTSDTKDKTWVGAGILVEKDKTVTWEVNGVSGDALHKIGEGTLIAQGNGDNKGSLNIGDGTVVLKQTGGKAFENIDIVSGRGTVKIGNQENADRLDTSKILFGFRGGKLDVNGFDLSFGDIRATDKGARIVNSDENKKVTITVDSSKFSKNNSIFHGQFGDTSEDKASKMDVKLINTTGTQKNFGITGGVNIDGDILQGAKTTLVLAGEYELPAGKSISVKDNGYFYTSKFKFNNIQMESGSEFQGGVYSDIEGDIKTTGNNKIVLGFVENETQYMYDLGQDTKNQNASLEKLNSNSKFKRITTMYKGNIDLKLDSNLLIGYTAMTGDITSDNSKITVSNSNITGDINLSNQSTLSATNTTLKGNLTQDNTSTSSGITNSVLIGTIQHEGAGTTKFDNSTWSIIGDSNLSNLSLKGSTIVFESEKALTREGIKFHNLKTENLTGDADVIFRADLSKGLSDKMIISNSTADSTLAVKVDNLTGDAGLELGSSVTLIETDDNNKINLVSEEGDKYVSVGSIKGSLDENGNLVLASYSQLRNNQVEWTSDMTNAALSDFTAKINLIKTQNELIGDIFDEMGAENYRDGVSYRGNFSNRVYRSDKFDKFEQNIINNALSYQTKLYESESWKNYLGVSFIYGVGDSKFRGDYKGKLESFTESIYTKLMHKDGYFVTGIIGGSYLRDKINSDKYETATGTLGAGVGYEKSFGGLKLSAGLDLGTYYITGENYRLDDPTALTIDKKTEVKTNDEYLLQVAPSVKIAYNYGYDKLNFGIYGKVGYDYNKYLLHSAPELKMGDMKNKDLGFRTGLIENGARFEVGAEMEYLSMKLSTGVVYFVGKDNTENLFTNLKFRYLF